MSTCRDNKCNLVVWLDFISSVNYTSDQLSDMIDYYTVDCSGDSVNVDIAALEKAVS